MNRETKELLQNRYNCNQLCTPHNNLLTFVLQQTIVASKNLYSFGPSDPNKRTKHPLVKLLNTPTTACSAKFRNHIPATVDIYYDDGREGSFQGTLDLGKEYTINTYEGHVFYFTEKGDKSKEVGRFTIDSNLVRLSLLPCKPFAMKV